MINVYAVYVMMCRMDYVSARIGGYASPLKNTRHLLGNKNAPLESNSTGASRRKTDPLGLNPRIRFWVVLKHYWHVLVIVLRHYP